MIITLTYAAPRSQDRGHGLAAANRDIWYWSGGRTGDRWRNPREHRVGAYNIGPLLLYQRDGGRLV